MHPHLNLFGRDRQQQQQQPQQQQEQQARQPQRVVFMTRRPEAAPEQEQAQGQAQAQERTIVIIDNATLKAFVRCVYIIAAILILIASITWLAIAFSKTDFKKAVPVPFFVWILLAFFFLMVMNCVPQTRYIFPLNWIITVIIVILFIFAGACLVAESEPLIILASVLGAIALIAVFYAIGALCPQKLLPGVLCTAVLACCLIILCIILVIVVVFVKNPIVGLVFVISLLLLVFLMMLFHAQYIHGRLNIVPLFDMLHCSLAIFIHFVLLSYSIARLVHFQKLM